MDEHETERESERKTEPRREGNMRSALKVIQLVTWRTKKEQIRETDSDETRGKNLHHVLVKNVLFFFFFTTKITLVSDGWLRLQRKCEWVSTGGKGELCWRTVADL